MNDIEDSRGSLCLRFEREIEGTLQREDQTTKAGTEDHLDGTIVLPSERIQITSKSDARKEVGKEDIDGASKDELVENPPI